MEVTAIRLKPPEAIVVLGRFDLDDVALEFDPAGVLHDCRFELGSGLDIYWAVPVKPCGRMRLLHVDNAAYEVEDVTIEVDPFEIDLAPLTWTGDLGKVGPGGCRTVVRASAEASTSPSGYRCDAEVRNGDGTTTVYSLSYSSSE